MRTIKADGRHLYKQRYRLVQCVLLTRLGIRLLPQRRHPRVCLRGFYLCIHCDCHCGDSFFGQSRPFCYSFFFFLLPACLLYTVLYYDHELYYIRRIYYICIYTHQSGTVNNELKAYASPKSGSLLAHTLLSHALFSVEGIDILTQPAVHLPQLLKSHRTMYGFVTRRRCDGCSNTHI